MDDPIDDLAFERLEDNSTIARDELGLAVARDDHALANVRDGHDGDDEAELAGAGPLDVGIQLRLEVLLHARSKVGRVEHDRVRELFLQKRMGRFRQGLARAREKEKGVTMKNIVVVVVVAFLGAVLRRVESRGQLVTKTCAARGSLSLSNRQHCGHPCFGPCAAYASRACVKNSQTYL